MSSREKDNMVEIIEQWLAESGHAKEDIFIATENGYKLTALGRKEMPKSLQEILISL